MYRRKSDFRACGDNVHPHILVKLVAGVGLDRSTGLRWKD